MDTRKSGIISILNNDDNPSFAVRPIKNAKCRPQTVTYTHQQIQACTITAGSASPQSIPSITIIRLQQHRLLAHILPQAVVTRSTFRLKSCRLGGLHTARSNLETLPHHQLRLVHRETREQRKSARRISIRVLTPSRILAPQLSPPPGTLPGTARSTRARRASTAQFATRHSLEKTT
ncbi:C2H2 transcription factor [Histoplasma capsulatum]|uniref:C2H2 transcription factor n=1 Tax=Ajellomyces capsulatus TaxID=5037 RepID=A0A8A1M411_AJECA|nr:C2H2 transcription factor [Histoplasma capsulatum]